jgi:phage shock protein C
MKKKLYRSRDDKIIAGIFGGLGEYTEMDSNLWRLIGLLIFIFTAGVPFLIAYLIAIFIIPLKEKEEEKVEK